MPRIRNSKLPVGFVVWQGPSLIDKEPLVVVANGFRNQSMNRKTGPMVQVYILREDVPPWGAIMHGQDHSICGDCKFRATGSLGSGRTCYVQVWPYVETIWKTYRRGSYIPLCDHEGDPFFAKFVRIGTYGDPAAVPTYVWQEIIKGAAGWTAYTHGWKTCDQALKNIAMASVDTPEEFAEARAMGWRTFRTRFSQEELIGNEIACPASAEADHKSRCIDCRLCDGDFAIRKGREDVRANIAIIAHGTGAGWFHKAREGDRQLRLPVIQ
jgi:hypothetical protein